MPLPLGYPAVSGGGRRSRTCTVYLSSVSFSFNLSLHFPESLARPVSRDNSPDGLVLESIANYRST